MGLNDLQSHITLNIGNTVDPVDLLKVALQFRKKAQNQDRAEKFKVIIDAECCLDRLYGGYFPDWVCGGQWNKMEQFLRNFAAVIQSSNLELVVCFNGSLERERLETEWKLKQEETSKFIEEIQRHVSHKRKPPPKIWWIPPTYLRTAIRSTFRAFQLRTMSTLDDHRKEIVLFCHKNNFHGIVADDPEYLLFDIPRYFSAQKLKLTFKGSLETVELKLKKVYDELNLPKEKFHIFAFLLGNNMLHEDDLIDFYAAIGVDPSSKTSYVEKVSEFVKGLDSCSIENVATQVAAVISDYDVDKRKDLSEKVAKYLNCYANMTVTKPTPKPKDKKSKGNKNSKKDGGDGDKEDEDSKSPKDEETKTEEIPSEEQLSASDAREMETCAIPSDNQDLTLTGDSSNIFCEAEQDQVVINGSGSPGKDAETEIPPRTNLDKLLYRVNTEIENVCITRHKNALMSPYIYHILKYKEIKLPVIIQETNKDLPRVHDLFRPLRQRVYAILFNLHHLHFLAKQRSEKTPTIQVTETFYCAETKSIKSELVQAVEVGWGVPTVERLWLGDKEECKRKRTRAFLAIMKSDKPIMLDPTFVPQQMLVLASVLRYILSSEKRFLRRAELEAFIAQAFIQEMTDPSIAQDIEVSNLSMRRVHLAHLFMEGVEMAGLANDACGAPIPYMLFSPWMFFNGKVLVYVMEQQSQGKSLAEICGYKMDLVVSIDQLRQAVTEGIKIQFADGPNPSPLVNNVPLIMTSPPRVPYLPNQVNPHMVPPSLSQLAAAANPRNRLMGSFGPSFQSHQNPFVMAAANANGPTGLSLYGNYPGPPCNTGLPTRGYPVYGDIPGRQKRAPPGRGQLEVAGMVVGSWGANYAGNVGMGNHMAPRNPRLPMIAGSSCLGQNLPMNAIFDHMRISGNKQPAFRSVNNQAINWNQKRVVTGKPQKKVQGRKEGGNAVVGGMKGDKSRPGQGDFIRSDNGADAEATDRRTNDCGPGVNLV